MRLIILAALAVLAGCAQFMGSMRDYVEPATGETAKVRFSTNGELRVFPKSNCINWSAPGAGIVVTNNSYIAGKPSLIGKKIGMKGEAPKGFSSAEVLVTANQPIAIDFSSHQEIGGWVYTCKYAYSFLPKVGEEYQITVNHDQAAGLCKYEPTSLTTPSQRVSIYKAEECSK